LESSTHHPLNHHPLHGHECHLDPEIVRAAAATEALHFEDCKKEENKNTQHVMLKERKKISSIFWKGKMK